MSEIRAKVKIPVWITALFCLTYLILGAAAGIVSKLADSNSEILGNITSGMCVWIFIGVTVCSFTKSPVRAAVYVLLFCAAMIAGYYLTAELADLYYSREYVRYWSVFTLFTPIFAFLTWYVRGKGKLPWVLRVGIAVVMLGCAFLLFPGNIFFDLLFTAGAFLITLKREESK